MISHDEARRRLAKPGPIISTGWGQTATTSHLEADRPMLRTIVALYECVDLLRHDYEPWTEHSEWRVRIDQFMGDVPFSLPMTPDQIAVLT